MELLENEADLISADISQALAAFPGNINAVQQYFTAGGFIHASDDIHHRTFSAA